MPADIGVRRFGSSIAGLGLCPFVPGAAGNVATEDLVYLCNELGMRTGADLEKISRYVDLVRELLGDHVVGRILPWYRSAAR